MSGASACKQWQARAHADLLMYPELSPLLSVSAIRQPLPSSKWHSLLQAWASTIADKLDASLEASEESKGQSVNAAS